MSRRITRRQALVTGGATALAALGFGILRVLSGGSPSGRVADARTSTSSSGAVDVAPDRHGGLARIARAYLEQYPDEASRGVLSATLPSDWVAGDASWSVLAAQVNADYSSGSVVVLDGWRLSRTEARAATLSVLESGWAADSRE